MTASQSNPSGAREAQVVIVGGGPVGLGLAIELGQRGVRTVLVERLLEPSPIPRGQNLTQRTMEHFHFWGVEQQVRAARTIPREYEATRSARTSQSPNRSSSIPARSRRSGTRYSRP